MAKSSFAGARQVAVRGTVCLSADALLRLTKGEEILAQPHQAQRTEEERSRKAGTEWRREASLRAESLSMKSLRGL